MTQKRFTMCFEQNDINGWTMSIVDWETKEPFNYTTYEVHSSSITDTKDEMEDLCLLLNDLNDENEQLKQALREQLEENGNAYCIEILDKIFDLKYDEWQRKMNETHTYDYIDWENVLNDKGVWND